MSKIPDGNIHKNHRSRLKEEYRTDGIDGFSLHNIVELLLFYSIPRKDTNVIAHKLANHYKTLANILDADYNDLINRDGIGENSATLIKLLPDLFRRYSMDKTTVGKVYDTVDSIAEFLISYYTAMTKEVVLILLMNNKNEIADHVKLHEGSINSGFISPDIIAEIVFTRRAANFILAHNHPNGDIRPSQEDILTTKMITNAFSMFNIKMLEHYIIAGTRYSTLIKESYGNNDKR